MTERFAMGWFISTLLIGFIIFLKAVDHMGVQGSFIMGGLIAAIAIAPLMYLSFSDR